MCPVKFQTHMHCWWIEINGSPKYKIHGNIGDLSKITFSYYSNDTERNTWVILSSYCPINDSSGYFHFVVYPTVMLHACWDTSEVTKSDKLHISRHKGFPNFVTRNLLNIYERVSKSKERVTGIHPSLGKY